MFVFLTGCSSSPSKIPKSEIANEYGVNENINIQFYRLDYDSFLSNQKNSSFCKQSFYFIYNINESWYSS